MRKSRHSQRWSGWFNHHYMVIMMVKNQWLRFIILMVNWSFAIDHQDEAFISHQLHCYYKPLRTKPTSAPPIWNTLVVTKPIATIIDKLLASRAAESVPLSFRTQIPCGWRLGRAAQVAQAASGWNKQRERRRGYQLLADESLDGMINLSWRFYQTCCYFNLTSTT